MKTRVDDRLRLEAQRFEFRFACESCAYFAPDKRACSEGYPSRDHLDPDLSGPVVIFCKLFEGA